MRPVIAAHYNCVTMDGVSRMAWLRALGLGALLAAAAGGGTAAAQPLDRPPPLQGDPAARPAESTAASAPATPRPAVDPDFVLEDLAPVRPTRSETRIEQRRAGNRIVELTVTPAGSTRSYTMVNREGQRPTNPQDLSSGLSTPRFLKFDF